MKNLTEPVPFPRLLTAKEVGGLLGISARAVHRRVKAGALRASRVVPNRQGLRFTVEDVRIYVMKTRVCERAI